LYLLLLLDGTGVQQAFDDIIQNILISENYKMEPKGDTTPDDGSRSNTSSGGCCK
jgi:hypothetical protein